VRQYLQGQASYKILSNVSNIHDFQSLSETLDWIASGRGSVFVDDVAGIAEVGDSFRDETVVDLLSVVEFMAAGDATSVEVADTREVVGCCGRCRHP
jgi:hypothetical protein